MQLDSITTTATAPMSHAAVIPDAKADIWREWQARGAASDRRMAARMRKVVWFIVAAFIAWFVVLLT